MNDSICYLDSYYGHPLNNLLNDPNYPMGISSSTSTCPLRNYKFNTSIFDIVTSPQFDFYQFMRNIMDLTLEMSQQKEYQFIFFWFLTIMFVLTLTYFLTKCCEGRKKKEEDYILIGLPGRKRVGKDTVGDYLCHKYNFIKLAYAGALKDACQDIFKFSDEQIYGDDLKEVVDEYWGHSPREILQKVGTELFRKRLPELCPNIADDIWIRSLDREIMQLRQEGFNRFVITDVRFPNEAEFVEKSGGKLWKIVRPSVSKTTFSDHDSEKFVDELKHDIEFVNDSSKQDLFRKIDREIKKIVN
jgi:hypothetical protein